MLASCVTASQPTPPISETGPPALLADAEAPRPQRVQAAIDLFNLADFELALPALVQAIEDTDSAAIVLEAILAHGLPPQPLWPHIRALASAPAGLNAPTLAGAIASFRSPQAAGLLISLTQSAPTRDLRDQAAISLSELLNEPSLAYDPAARKAWIAESAAWDDDRWRREIQHAQRDLMAQHRLRAERAERRLVELARQVWIATPDTEREGALAGLLDSEIDALRSLASELIREMIASGKAIPESAQNRAIAMLANARAEVRADAATLVVQIAPQSAGPAVLQALLKEHDPRAAGPLLQASTRWPTPEVIEPVLRWLEHGGPISPVAADAALTLHRADLLASPTSIERLRLALRLIEPARLNTSACRLLVTLGGDPDRAFVQTLLSHDRPAVRLAAATALATHQGFVDALLQAAARDPLLIDSAARAVETHSPTPEGVLSLDPLYSANPQSVDRAQLVILRTLSVAQIINLSKRLTTDPCRAATSLAVIAERSVDADSTPEFIAARLEGINLLAGAQFRCGQFPQAIATLTPLDPESLTDASVEILSRASIRTANFQAALDRSTPIAIWLNEHSILDAPDDAEQRAALTAFIIQNLAESLAEDALLALQRELAAADPETPDLANADPPADGPIENSGGDPD